MTTRRRICLGGMTCTLVLAVGCALAAGEPRAAATLRGRDVTPRPRRAGDVMTADLIAQAGMGTGSGLDALARLRPELLRRERARPGMRGTPGALVLYVDGTLQGPVALLADVRASGISEMRYLRPAEALAWFGPGHEGGVIAVRIRKQ